MSRRNLEHLFNPRSVALIGASDRPHSVGATVMGNLTNGGFAGPIWPVNLRHATVAGRHAYPSVAELPEAPDLAVICTPAVTVPDLISQLGVRGTRAAIVVSGGLEQRSRGETGETGETIASAMLKAAEPFTLRILGPNCIGLLVPGIGLNASFAHLGASAGNLAFIAQSGALTTAMLDWAHAKRIGFSHFISLGNAADVDFGDLLDYLAREPKTHAILLYIESITCARKFMSAARTAARNKPVIAVKAGRTSASARAAHSHSGALAGADAVYETALRRAGILRVDTTRELFDAAEVLARMKPFRGPRLAIVGNGGGPGVMATDALTGQGGQLAELGAGTMEKLDSALPTSWSHGNPLDIGGDARPERYLATLGPLLEDPGTDAVLVIHSPTAVASVAEVAAACLPVLSRGSLPALACWMGAEDASQAPAAPADVPVYPTPEEAVGAFLYVARYHESQAVLLEAPPSSLQDFKPDVQAARSILSGVFSQGRSVLTEPEAKDVLAAYGVPVVETRIVRSVADASAAAEAIGYPLALKILSPDISHKSDVGGVTLDLETPEALQRAADSMLARCRERAPQARIEGFTLQKMVRRGGAHELIAGMAVDPTFGPVMVFGQGGTAVEVIADRALALPPLNSTLARDLISRTRVHHVLSGYRDHPAVDLAALEQTLMRLSQLVADLPEVIELDINPLLADAHGVLALDARIRIERTALAGTERFAIRPYPGELEERVGFCGQTILLRPIRPDDFELHRRFLARITPEDLQLRLFAAVRQVPERELAHLTQIDYEREMAFIAVAPGDGETLGVARACTDPENRAAEFAVLVRSDLKGRGLGALLLDKLVRYCRSRGTQRMRGQARGENTRMLKLGAAAGFHIEQTGAGICELSLDLQSAESPPSGA
jgi:acetyltransferase